MLNDLLTVSTKSKHLACTLKISIFGEYLKLRRNSLCTKRGENWVRVGTAKHLWIDWMDRGSFCHIVYEPYCF